MNGITERAFIELCQALNDSIIEYTNTETQDQRKEMNMLLYISEIIDQSHGMIETNDENIKNSFKQIFELARSVKQYNYFVSHSRSAIRKAQNDNELDETVRTMYINQKLYHNYIEKLYNFTSNLCNEKSMEKK